MEISDEKFNQVKNDAERYYKSIGKVRCPYLHEDVHFNAEGFDHLLFKSWNRGRSKQEQYTRLRLLPLAVKIISKSHTLQEYNECEILVRQKINSCWERRMKLVRYYAFIAIIKEVRLKIIVKEIDGGSKFFHSLYPSWKIRNQNGKQRKIMYYGNLEKD